MLIYIDTPPRGYDSIRKPNPDFMFVFRHLSFSSCSRNIVLAATEAISSGKNNNVGKPEPRPDYINGLLTPLAYLLPFTTYSCEFNLVSTLAPLSRRKYSNPRASPLLHINDLSTLFDHLLLFSSYPVNSIWRLQWLPSADQITSLESQTPTYYCVVRWLSPLQPFPKYPRFLIRFSDAWRDFRR